MSRQPSQSAKCLHCNYMVIPLLEADRYIHTLPNTQRLEALTDLKEQHAPSCPIRSTIDDAVARHQLERATC